MTPSTGASGTDISTTASTDPAVHMRTRAHTRRHTHARDMHDARSGQARSGNAVRGCKATARGTSGIWVPVSRVMGRDCALRTH